LPPSKPRVSSALTPEVEKAVDKFVKYATESGIEALRVESRSVLQFQPAPNTYQTFTSMPDRNRFPAERVYILTQGPKHNSIEEFWRMIFQVSLCNVS
uniref:Tyrosine-protein phosphatase domain-containing protein n=1 Tax=Angiostrongylus cantonensis TaxID=6313 RepID=A0A0K0DNW6_ANGCA